MRLRRSVLFTPATRADRWRKALAGPADVCVADLEDAVPPAEKASARKQLAAALQDAPRGRAEVGVRINAWPSAWAEEDVDALAPLRPELVAVPKCEDPEEVRSLAGALQQRGCDAGLLLLVETARGVLRAPELALASKRVRAIAFGAEDYAASVGAQRTRPGLEVLYARSRVVAAAAAADVDAIDQVFTDLKDLPGLEEDARAGAQLGYRGKMLIHPDQVAVVHDAYRPGADAVARARRIVDAARAAGAQAGGVVVVDGRMVDRPSVLQAERVLVLAGAP